MLKNSSFPGSTNGTGLFQTIAGLKVGGRGWAWAGWAGTAACASAAGAALHGCTGVLKYGAKGGELTN